MKCAYHRFDLLAALDRTAHRDSRRQNPCDRLGHLFDRRGGLRHHVDSIQPAAQTEGPLKSRNIHHGQTVPCRRPLGPTTHHPRDRNGHFSSTGFKVQQRLWADSQFRGQTLPEQESAWSQEAVHFISLTWSPQSLQRRREAPLHGIQLIQQIQSKDEERLRTAGHSNPELSHRFS